MKNLEDMRVITAGGDTINNIKYADNAVLITENEGDFLNLVDAVIKFDEKIAQEGA